MAATRALARVGRTSAASRSRYAIMWSANGDSAGGSPAAVLVSHRLSPRLACGHSRDGKTILY